MMSETKKPAPWVIRLLVGGMVVPPILFLSSVPWLKTLPDNVVFLVGGLASVAVLASSMVFAIIKDRRADEFTRMSARFSGHWGFVGGGALLALLLSIPPFRDLIVAVAEDFQDAEVDDTLVMMSFTAGFMACIIAQMIATLVLGLGWRLWMSRAI